MRAAGMVAEAFSDFVVGHGELWCAQLLTATLKKMGVSSAFMDTREILVVTPTSDGNSVDVDYEESNARLDKWGQKHGSPSVSLPLSQLSLSLFLTSSDPFMPRHLLVQPGRIGCPVLMSSEAISL